MNLVNPYRFIPPIPVAVENTFIGGVASTINTPALLAAKLAIDVSRITVFSVVGSDIKCRINGDYLIPDYAFSSSSYPEYEQMTYYYDYENCKSIGNAAFHSLNKNSKIKKLYFKEALIIGSDLIAQGTTMAIEEVILPKATTLNGVRHFIANKNLKITYIPLVTKLGDTVGNEEIWDYSQVSRKGHIIYCHPSLATNNAGATDGDLANAIANGYIVRYVSNLTAPNPITTLSTGTIYNTTIQLNFTAPSSTNAIDYYECYVNGILKNRITASGEYIVGLTANTAYTFTVIAVDVFYNKSVVSNSVSSSTNNNPSAVPLTSLVSYYKLESSSVDSYGSNSGVDTEVTYGVGKIGNGAVFNGSTSQISRASSSFDFFGIQKISFNCWVKLNAMPSNFIDLISVQEVGNANTIDKAVRLFNNGSASFYAYDGASKEAKSEAGLIAINNWYMITGTYDGVNLKIYINAVLRHNTACSGSYNFINPQLTIGKSNLGVLNGMIDEIPIYSNALTQNQIDILYNNGNGITL